MGTPAWLGSRPRALRRGSVIALFAVAGLYILATAEHFAQALVDAGTALGIDQFLLVQWVAPVASESPELIVACLYAIRLKASHSLGTLLSSKVNQWTLLVGTIPVVFALAARTFDGLPLDTHQRYELLITAAQSLFAVSVLINLGLTVAGAVTLFVLFAIQFAASITLPTGADRILLLVMSALYVALAVGQFVRRRRSVMRTVRDGLVTPFRDLEETAPGKR